METTELQEKIINSSGGAKLIVKAGPGTGKTFCLIERIKFLVKVEQLEPATEILILSFSVAAAREVKNRLQEAVRHHGYDEELLYIPIRTFDSFASSFMYKIDPDIDFTDCDYDQRIAMVTETINTNEDARSRLHSYRHIMVDEVQDLVGLRASLTLAVLSSCGGGFTLFGDPAQAVYNFLMGGVEEGPTSDEFLEEVYKSHGEAVKDFFLSENFRVGENKQLKEIADTGRKHLISSPPTVAYNFLRRTFAELPSLGSLQEVALPDQLCSSDTAFLSRTNGQLLKLAKLFAEKQIDFTIRRPLEERDIPAWVGHVFSSWKSQSIKKRDFLDALGELMEKNSLDPELFWRELSQVTRVRTSIRVPQFRKALLEDGVFSESDKIAQDNGVILSTVHRSKGREFQDVVLIIPEEADPEEYLDEGRVMFVGLTRARRSLHKMAENGAKGMRKSGDRWISTRTAKGQRILTGIEVGCQGDVDPHSSVSNAMFESYLEEIEENQDFLWENVEKGSKARLEFYQKKNSAPIYYIRILHDGDDLAVGLTSQKFGYSLKNIISEMQGRTATRYPRLIEDLLVRDVVTEIGDLGCEDVPRKFRTTGLWLGVRLQGLGTCRDWGNLA